MSRAKQNDDGEQEKQNDEVSSQQEDVGARTRATGTAGFGWPGIGDQEFGRPRRLDPVAATSSRVSCVAHVNDLAVAAEVPTGSNAGMRAEVLTGVSDGSARGRAARRLSAWDQRSRHSRIDLLRSTR